MAVPTFAYKPSTWHRLPFGALHCPLPTPTALRAAREPCPKLPSVKSDAKEGRDGTLNTRTASSYPSALRCLGCLRGATSPYAVDGFTTVDWGLWSPPAPTIGGVQALVDNRKVVTALLPSVTWTVTGSRQHGQSPLRGRCGMKRGQVAGRFEPVPAYRSYQIPPPESQHRASDSPSPMVMAATDAQTPKREDATNQQQRPDDRPHPDSGSGTSAEG